MLKQQNYIWLSLLLTSSLVSIWLFIISPYQGIEHWNSTTSTDTIETNHHSALEISPDTLDSVALSNTATIAHTRNNEATSDFLLLERVQNQWSLLNREPEVSASLEIEERQHYQQLIDDVVTLKDKHMIDPITAMRIHLDALKFTLDEKEYLQAEQALLAELNEEIDTAKKNQELALHQSESNREHQIYKIKESVLVDSIISEMQFDSIDERDAYIGKQLKQLRLGQLDVPL